jgi:hypothetical protein
MAMSLRDARYASIDSEEAERNSISTLGTKRMLLAFDKHEAETRCSRGLLATGLLRSLFYGRGLLARRILIGFEGVLRNLWQPFEQVGRCSRIARIFILLSARNLSSSGTSQTSIKLLFGGSIADATFAHVIKLVLPSGFSRCCLFVKTKKIFELTKQRIVDGRIFYEHGLFRFRLGSAQLVPSLFRISFFVCRHWRVEPPC